MRGRKPLPTVIKRMRGNPGQRRLNDWEPRPAGPLPDCPDELQGRAREAWETFAPALNAAGIGGDLDATALLLLCNSLGLYRDAMAEVARSGPVWLAKGEGLPTFRLSPYWKIAAAEWHRIQAMLTEFGLTPSTRSRLAANPPEHRDEFDLFLEQA